MLYVARGGASRQGLKHLILLFFHNTRYGGSWRGFPPGIETVIHDAFELIPLGGSWRGFPPGIETYSMRAFSVGDRRGSWRGFPPGIETLLAPRAAHAPGCGSWRGFPPGIETKIEFHPQNFQFGVARGGASRQGLKPKCNNCC